MAYETMSIAELRAIRARLERALRNRRLSQRNFMRVVGYYVTAGVALDTALHGPRGERRKGAAWQTHGQATRAARTSTSASTSDG